MISKDKMSVTVGVSSVASSSFYKRDILNAQKRKRGTNYD